MNIPDTAGQFMLKDAEIVVLAFYKIYKSLKTFFFKLCI